MMDAKLEAHSRRIEANQSEPMRAIHQLSQQINPIPTPSVQPITHQKKKRNQRTREHYKKKAKAQVQVQAQATHVTTQVQEMDQVKEMEHSALSNHVVKKQLCVWMVTSRLAIISYG